MIFKPKPPARLKNIKVPVDLPELILQQMLHGMDIPQLAKLYAMDRQIVALLIGQALYRRCPSRRGKTYSQFIAEAGLTCMVGRLRIDACWRLYRSLAEGR